MQDHRLAGRSTRGHQGGRRKRRQEEEAEGECSPEPLLWILWEGMGEVG